MDRQRPRVVLLSPDAAGCRRDEPEHSAPSAGAAERRFAHRGCYGCAADGPSRPPTSASGRDESDCGLVYHRHLLERYQRRRHTGRASGQELRDGTRADRHDLHLRVRILGVLDSEPSDVSGRVPPVRVSCEGDGHEQRKLILSLLTLFHAKFS